MIFQAFCTGQNETDVDLLTGRDPLDVSLRCSNPRERHHPPGASHSSRKSLKKDARHHNPAIPARARLLARSLEGSYMHKSLFFALAAVSGLLLTTTGALAASDYFLKIDDVKGEAKDGAVAGSTEVSSFSWGASNPSAAATTTGMGAGKASMQDLSVTREAAAAPRDAASGMPTGKRQHKPMMAMDDPSAAAVAPAAPDTSVRSVSVTIPEPGNATSQYLDRACANGEHIKEATLGGRGQQVRMSDVVVTACSAAGNERKYEMRGHVTLMK
jgi:type VI protein secretion system component Hcp